MIIFTLTNIDTQQVDFTLQYDADAPVQFTTISGESGHVFNWDMMTGSLIMDGTKLMTHTITIERI